MRVYLYDYMNSPDNIQGFLLDPEVWGNKENRLRTHSSYGRLEREHAQFVWTSGTMFKLGDFELQTKMKSDSFELAILMSIPTDSETGYPYEINLFLLEELPDYFSDLLPAAEQIFSTMIN